jgi:hypothetical protein
VNVLCLATLSALLACASTDALAQQRPADVEMRLAMHDYFAGEYREGWAFLGVGLAAGGAGATLLALGTDLTIGTAIPVIAIGVIQLAAGIVLLARTGGQVRDLDLELTRDENAYRDAELPRIRRVNTEFDILMIVEIGLTVAGAVTFGVGIGTETDIATGIGLGTMIQSLAMLVLDLFAGARADDYTEALEAFEPSTGATDAAAQRPMSSI